MAAAFRRARYPFENMTAPCAIEKVRPRLSFFSLFSIQFDDASNDRFKDIQVRSKHIRNSKRRNSDSTNTRSAKMSRHASTHRGRVYKTALRCRSFAEVLGNSLRRYTA